MVSFKNDKHCETTVVYVNINFKIFLNFLNQCFCPGDNGKEKLIPLLQGPSDTRDLHSTKWLNESRKPESLLAPDLVAFTVQVPQSMDDCHHSGTCSPTGHPSKDAFSSLEMSLNVGF